MANVIMEGRRYGRDLAEMWIAGYRAAKREGGIVECADCALHGTDSAGDYCELFDAYLPGMAEDGFCKWGSPADSSEDFSNWSLNEGRDDG